MRKSILPLIPPHENYLEPFAGGASVFFLKGEEMRAQLNDLDAELINCFVHIRDHSEALIGGLETLDVDPDTHRFMRDEFQPADDLDRATRYFYLNHTSYAGITHLRTCYWGARSPYSLTHKGWAKRIRQAYVLLQGVHLINRDFEEVIEAAPDESFLFVDAPYCLARHYKYYAHVFCWEDHQRLAACLKRHYERLRFLVTYDDCLQIRELYQWAPYVSSVERPNQIERTDNKIVSDRAPARRSVGHDLLIRNYANSSHKWRIMFSRASPAASDFVALTDEQWAVVEPLLPRLPRRSDGRGRPWRESRAVLDGILWVIARGVPWHTLPACYPPFQTCHRWFFRLRTDGSMQAVIEALRDKCGLDLSRAALK